jgi:hypothetical protein
LLLWGSACSRLKHRDEWIGWTGQQRAAWQKLVVQNRRFVLLAEPSEHPNLASRILGKVVRELPSLWLEAFGYEPLLAAPISGQQHAGGAMRPCMIRINFQISFDFSSSASEPIHV